MCHLTIFVFVWCKDPTVHFTLFTSSGHYEVLFFLSPHDACKENLRRSKYRKVN